MQVLLASLPKGQLNAAVLPLPGADVFTRLSRRARIGICRTLCGRKSAFSPKSLGQVG
jgi:hypothetical protein